MSTAEPRLNCVPAGASAPCTVADTKMPSVLAEQGAGLQAGGGQRGLGLGQRLAGQVGHHHEVDALRRRDRHRRAAGDARRAVGRGRRHDRSRRHGVAEHRLGEGGRQLDLLQRGGGLVDGEPDERRHGPRRRTGGDHELDLRCPGGPDRRSSATASAGTVHEITEPTATFSSFCCTGGAATSCSSASSVSASAWVSPARSGRSRNSGPSLTTTRNGSSSASCSPAAGAVRMISPAVGWASLRSWRISMSQLNDAVSARGLLLGGPDELGDGVLGHLEQVVREERQPGRGRRPPRGRATHGIHRRRRRGGDGVLGRRGRRDDRRRRTGRHRPVRPAPSAPASAVGGPGGPATSSSSGSAARAASSSRIRSSSPS